MRDAVNMLMGWKEKKVNMEVVVIQGVEMFMKEQGQNNMGAWKKGTHVGQFTGSRKASQER